MKREKIQVDSSMLDILIVIYSFNNTSISFLTNILKIDDKKISRMLTQLTTVGILGIGHQILVRKDIARQMMMDYGVFYTGVEYFEAIYRYQQSIQQKHPELIQNPKVFIYQKPEGEVELMRKKQDSVFYSRTKKIVKYLLIANAIVGSYVLWNELF